MNPKVTIILPTLNMEPYIRQSMDSVLNQTLKEIEVFVVDASSTDRTRDIVEEPPHKEKHRICEEYRYRKILRTLRRHCRAGRLY